MANAICKRSRCLHVSRPSWRRTNKASDWLFRRGRIPNPSDVDRFFLVLLACLRVPFFESKCRFDSLFCCSIFVSFVHLDSRSAMVRDSLSLSLVLVPIGPVFCFFPLAAAPWCKAQVIRSLRSCQMCRYSPKRTMDLSDTLQWSCSYLQSWHSGRSVLLLHHDEHGLIDLFFFP